MRKSRELTLTSRDRVSLRKELIDIFLEEEPGTGTGEECSYYNYYVETLVDKRRIYLKRPAYLNKGFDFEVHVENVNFGTLRRRSRPTHEDIYQDLSSKIVENPIEYEKVRRLLNDVFECQPLDDAAIAGITFHVGYPIELILKAVNWLYIEQDMTYWNWSGRNRLHSHLISL